MDNRSTAAQRTAIITGGNLGLGYETAKILAAEGSEPFRWHVLLACRDVGRGTAAAEKLKHETGNPAVEVVACDLASLAAVRQCAETIERTRADRPPIAALICNAGSQTVSGLAFSQDGYEVTFAVNHLGHFLLVDLLRPMLAPRCRIVIVASGTHDRAQNSGLPAPELGTIYDLATPTRDDFDRQPKFAGRRAYATSKLCNVLFGYELARRMTAAGIDVTVNGFDPGMMPGTGLARDYDAGSRVAWRFIMPVLTLLAPNVNRVTTSARNLARLVTDPALSHVTGRYFIGRNEARSSEQSYDQAVAARLWEVSLELIERAQS
jgi:NAD(P)-dependent dehydrogenase (short-subunit alcohol dehydrogenase family)